MSAMPPMPDLSDTQRRALAACVMVQASAYRTDTDRFGRIRSIAPWRRMLMAQPHSWKELSDIAIALIGEDEVSSQFRVEGFRDRESGGYGAASTATDAAPEGVNLHD